MWPRWSPKASELGVYAVCVIAVDGAGAVKPVVCGLRR